MCIHSHSVGNCPVENVKFGPKTTIGRIFLSPYFTCIAPKFCMFHKRGLLPFTPCGTYKA